jgi:hypothetical protein
VTTASGKDGKKKKDKPAGKGLKKLKTNAAEKEDIEKASDPIALAGAAAE